VRARISVSSALTADTSAHQLASASARNTAAPDLNSFALGCCTQHNATTARKVRGNPKFMDTTKRDHDVLRDHLRVQDAPADDVASRRDRELDEFLHRAAALNWQVARRARASVFCVWTDVWCTQTSMLVRRLPSGCCCSLR
jgi:hypothetical protein